MTFFLFAQSCEQTGGQQGNPILQLVPLLLIFVVFYFLLIRPQQKKQKEHRKMVEGINRGDRIITSSGIHGTVAGVKDRTFVITIADGVKIEVEKSHVVTKLNKTMESQNEGN
ncbi:preprotein translocase subunit YajC [candidate division WOR-3 bacterium RBG_13_43_14]|uniref:Preprotein translocase subunit YajC n=1 Tax=candidate division WOR-3 bacterium RBG_13_43_14 TaxID=1802590 RepID=A0A1F4UA25_UNCW3|nr:MAG: preprotein translocase subunit YajC [candidate division WOR-3 bacterium RBG_13_43_14]